jgi:hypothetical protein
MRVGHSLFAALLFCSVISLMSSAETTTYGSNDVYEVVLKAANDGNASAQSEIGKRFARNTNPPDYDNAIIWFRKAAEQGFPSAQRNLGIGYLDGLGVAKDEAEAVRWFRKAAEQGLASAQRVLAECYLEGQGVSKDKEEAVKWFQRAAAQGDEFSQERCRELNSTQYPSAKTRHAIGGVAALGARPEEMGSGLPVVVLSLPKGFYSLGNPFCFKYPETGEYAYYGNKKEFGIKYYQNVFLNGDLKKPAYLMMLKPKSSEACEYLQTSEEKVLVAIVRSTFVTVVKGKDMDREAFRDGLCLPPGLKRGLYFRGFVIK